MIRQQRCQRTGISASHISPLSPYIFPICAASLTCVKSSKSVLALARYISNRRFAIEHPSPTGFQEIANRKPGYPFLAVTTLSRHICAWQLQGLFMRDTGGRERAREGRDASALSRCTWPHLCIRQFEGCKRVFTTGWLRVPNACEAMVWTVG